MLRGLMLAASLVAGGAAASDLDRAIQQAYQSKLRPLYEHFHAHPELGLMEFETSKRLAQELRALGFTVTEGVGKTGVVALLKNGPGPTVLMRADMDGLPVQEKSGLPFASKKTGKDLEGNTHPVMHACGHDTHMTGLVGTAMMMVARRAQWSGTLMLIGQPAEERVAGARAMVKDGLWARFGKPDYAIGWHISAELPTGTINVLEGAAYSGTDTVDILVKGVGTHGAAPHNGKDPVAIAVTIYNGLQNIVTRERAPRDPGLITVGALHAGTRGNIISDEARMQLTVRWDSEATRKILLDGIERVAQHAGRMAGMPEPLLPVVTRSDSTPAVINDPGLTRRLRALWVKALGSATVSDSFERPGMQAEDFYVFGYDAKVPSFYLRVGATPPSLLEQVKQGKATLGFNHSPQFNPEADAAIQLAIKSMSLALLELMPKHAK